jgi:hypothetical protein
VKRKIISILVMTLLISTIIPIVSGIEQELKIISSPTIIDAQQLNTSQKDWLQAGVDNWQIFYNRGKTIEKVDLHFGCYFGDSKDVTLSIEDSLGGTILTYVTYPASAFPLNVQTWFTFDFPDVKLVQGRLYYMVIRFNSDSEYAWSGDFGNPYTKGWSSHSDPNWDYAFMTYVDEPIPYNNQILSPGMIDQQQPNNGQIDWLQGGIPNFQTFYNRGETLEEVELHFGCWYSGSYDVKLSIRETLTGSSLTDVIYPTSAFPPDVQTWFTFNVPDVQLVQGKIYFIVVEFDPGSEYAWSGDVGNPYPPGVSSHSDPNWDYAFRTIVDKSKPKTLVTPFLQILLERFPNMLPILRQILVI